MLSVKYDETLVYALVLDRNLHGRHSESDATLRKPDASLQASLRKNASAVPRDP